MFGTRWLATLAGFAFFSHQVGGFLGVWLGGIVFDRTGSYDAGVVARDPVRRAVGADQHADRGEAGAARRRRAGLIRSARTRLMRRRRALVRRIRP